MMNNQDYPTIFSAVKYLWRHGISLTIPFLCLGPHELLLVLHARRRDVNQYKLDLKAVQYCYDPVLVVFYLHQTYHSLTINS